MDLWNTETKPATNDEARENEWYAQVRVALAATRLREAINEAIPLSDLMRGRLIELAHVLDDYTPDATAWDEQIDEAYGP